MQVKNDQDRPPTMLAFEHGGRVRWYCLCGYESSSREREMLERHGERILDVEEAK